AYSSLTAANITTGKSNDGGNTFGVPNPYSQQVAGDDRMWMSADTRLNNLGFDDVYMTYHDVSALDIELGVSRDGGQTYVQNGPIGARYDRIFPITAVDAGGNVYAIWTDGNHIMYKVDATGTGWNPAAAPGQIANPAGVNTTIMPWAAAGKSGIADVVFYGASGGAGAQPNPQDDPNN